MTSDMITGRFGRDAIRTAACLQADGWEMRRDRMTPWQHDVLGRDAGRRLRTKCMPGLRRKDAARFVVMDSVCV